MLAKMNHEELVHYLNDPLVARLATSDRGWPHVVPVWFEYDGESFWIPSQVKTSKVRHIRKDNHVSLVIDTFSQDHTRFRRVIVKGEAELVKDEALKTDLSTSRTARIFSRYLGKDCEKTPHGADLLVIERLLVKVKPLSILALKEEW
jgi:nitroimidazol reductase NimA-like FMN-containing flavoprotein (pyridoxamine 5'-phosphate oxidase superfamily)